MVGLPPCGRTGFSPVRLLIRGGSGMLHGGSPSLWRNRVFCGQVAPAGVARGCCTASYPPSPCGENRVFSGKVACSVVARVLYTGVAPPCGGPGFSAVRSLLSVVGRVCCVGGRSPAWLGRISLARTGEPAGGCISLGAFGSLGGRSAVGLGFAPRGRHKRSGSGRAGPR